MIKRVKNKDWKYWLEDRPRYNDKLKRMVTRKEWEKDHKPTCPYYPCNNWQELHWHLNPPEPILQENK